MQKKLLLSLLTLVAPLVAWAQTITVNGTVTDNVFNEPVMAATVVETGTSNGVATDMDGKFTLTVPKNSTITISFVGYKTQVLKPQAIMNVVLEENSELLDEMVVTGYMQEKKADLTGAVSVVKMKDVADIPTGNVMQALQGRVAGMNITTDGTPGGGTTSTLVRGTTTINNSSPLYIIDGVPTRDNVGTIISSGDIESIQVLKDASSAAIYGAQAANGVIIITTKRAKKGEINVDFNMSLTAQTFSTGMDLLTAQQWGDCYWQAFKYANGGNTPNSLVYGNGATAVMQPYYYDQDGVKIRVADTDWADEIYSTALMQTYNLTLSKGTENSSSSLSVNYMDQDGMCRNTDYQNFSTRLSNDFKFLNDRLRIGENFSVNRWTQHLNPGGIEENVIAQHPAIPVYDENGGYAGGYVDILGDKPNLIRLTDNEANNRHVRWRLFGNAYVEIEPIKNLVLRSNFGVNYYTENNSEFVPSWREGARTVNTNELSSSNATQFDWTWTNQASYAMTLADKHSFTFLLGMEAKKNRYDWLYGYGTGLQLESLDYAYLDVVTAGKNVGGTSNTYSMVSYFGKINYSFDSKYLASFTLRRDASSRFGSKNNSGTFPSASVGWRISNEKFMEKTHSWMDDLKIRASWGINGNDQINNSATYNLFANSLNNAGYNLNGDGSTLVAGTVKTHTGNNYLRWEQTNQVNLGFDAAFLNNRLLISADYYNKNTKDMLYEPAYAGVIGEGGYSYQNSASMNNKGFEGVITWRDRIKKDWSYEVGFNFAVQKNKITKLPDAVYYTFGCGNGVDISNIGYAYGSWLGYKTDGVFHTQAEVDEYNQQYNVEIGAPGVGRIKYLDANGDGKINANDRVVLGHDLPKFSAGLNLSVSYKNFDLSLFFSGMVRKAWNNSKYYTDLFQCWTGNHSTHLLDALNAWNHYEQTGRYDSNVPALTTNNSNNEDRGSDFYVENGNYIKLKTATLGYTLPKSLLEKAHIRQARVFIQAQNLFTITSYKGADPEGLGYTYPMPRTFTFGLSVGL
ncbi:MAG: TonB-dependent receptor [Bacteroidaceae bacterium]|nr:TonB-dependent receptor [Bacteroidaceae bacterium]